MNIKAKLLVASCLFSFFNNVYPESNFILTPLAKGISIEIPKNWTVLNGSNRMTLDSYVESSGYKLTESSLNFAANLYDENGKVLALVNARFYPNNQMTQDMAKSLNSADLIYIDKEMHVVSEKTIDSIGGKLHEWIPTQVVRINGLYVIKYGQLITVPPTNKQAYQFSYRVWAAPRSFTITIGYNKNQEFLIKPIADKIASSLVMK